MFGELGRGYSVRQAIPGTSRHRGAAGKTPRRAQSTDGLIAREVNT
jgi:hypothetical protein